MSIEVARWAKCDGCGEVPWMANLGLPLLCMTATEARREAKAQGWHHERAKGNFPAHDLCPDCCMRLGWREEDLLAAV